MSRDISQIRKDIDELFDTVERFRSSLHNRQYFEKAFEQTAERLLQVYEVAVPKCEELARELNSRTPVLILKAALVARVQNSKVISKSTSVQKPRSDVPDTPLPDGQSAW